MILYVLLLLFCTPCVASQDPFAPIAPIVAQQLYQTLKDVHDLCDLHNITYWIDSGTLLGAVRHRGLIPWDDDLDICMFAEDAQKFIAHFSVMEHIGYMIVGMPFGYKIYHRNGASIPNYPWLHPGCDIFLVVKNDTKLCYAMLWGKERAGNKEVKLSDVFPLRSYIFGPLVVSGPHNPLPYLNNWYGDQYMTVAYRDFDHAIDSRITQTIKELTPHDYKALWPAAPLEDRVKPTTIHYWPVDFLASYPGLLDKRS